MGSGLLKFPTVKCACGCGKSLRSVNKWGYRRRYIHGHNSMEIKKFIARQSIIPERIFKFSERTLRHYYLKQGFSTLRIAKMFGCSWMTVRRRLLEVGVSLRSLSKTKKHRNKLYRAHETYGKNWYKIRLKVIKRDNYKCQMCGLSRIKCIQKFKRDFIVHHLVSKNSFKSLSKANKKKNLITLCPSCHRKLHNRQMWDQGEF